MTINRWTPIESQDLFVIHRVIKPAGLIGCLSCFGVSLSVNPLDSPFYFYYFFLPPYFNLATLNGLCYVCLLWRSKQNKQMKNKSKTDYSVEITQINKNKLYLMRVTFDSCKN